MFEVDMDLNMEDEEYPGTIDIAVAEYVLLKIINNVSGENYQSSCPLTSQLIDLDLKQEETNDERQEADPCCYHLCPVYTRSGDWLLCRQNIKLRFQLRLKKNAEWFLPQPCVGFIPADNDILYFYLALHHLKPIISDQHIDTCRLATMVQQ